MLSRPYFVKKPPICRKHVVLMPVFYQKMSTLPKCRYSHVIFFQIFREKPNAIMHIIVLKNASSVKTKLYYATKKSIGFTFFPSFLEKITAFILVFCQKNIRSVKSTSKKRLLCQKLVLECHFFSNFYE